MLDHINDIDSGSSIYFLYELYQLTLLGKGYEKTRGIVGDPHYCRVHRDKQRIAIKMEIGKV